MDNRRFYATFLNIAWPIALQHLVTSSLNLIDTLMIGGLGEAAIAAVGVANKLTFFFVVSAFGIYSACGIFAAQYWGKRQIEQVHRVMGVMLTFGTLFALIFVAIATLLPQYYMRLFTDDAQVIALGIDYLKIIAPSYIFTTISFMYAYISRSIHMTRYPMYISVFALSLNTVLNYALIYGHFGAPALGVSGAAIATATARVVELALFILVIYKLVDHPLRARLKALLSYKRDLVVGIIKHGFAVFINESSWALGNTVYFMAFGLLGKSALAVVQIASTVTDVFVSLFIGLSSACGVMLGNALGASEFDTARLYSRKFIRITLVLAAAVLVILLLITWFMPQLYGNFDSQTKHLLSLTLFVMAFAQIPKMYNFTAIVGILRSGGDTLFCMMLDIIGVWVIGIPLAFFAAIYLDVPIYIVVAFAYFEEYAKSIPAFYRVRSGKWINNVVDETIV